MTIFQVIDKNNGYHYYEAYDKEDAIEQFAKRHNGERPIIVEFRAL